MTTAHAQCICGCIKVQATLPSKWVAHCHCSLCRRAHGAAFVTWVGMDAARCVIIDTERQLQWFESTPGAERGFCRHCGGMMFFRSGEWAGELHIALAHFTGPVDRLPQAHAYWSDHVQWASIDPGDGLPRKSPAG